MLKVKDFLADAVSALGSTSEAEAIAVRLCEEVLGVKSWQWVLEPSMEVSPSAEARLSSSLQRLRGGEPLQYVLGYADFCGFRFNVGPSVLIPRPETEELCRLVVREVEGMVGGSLQGGSSLKRSNPIRESGFKGLRIIDLCTGSGCIAWTLALLLPSAEVIGVDVSEEALSVARSQPLGDEAVRYGAKVPQFCKGDILSLCPANISDTPNMSAATGYKTVHAKKTPSENGESTFSENIPLFADEVDVIVSNPPYVRLSERDTLPENVKNHEPALALFVPDDDPLIFYRVIANFSMKRLRTGGFGFVEINEALGEPTEAIFTSTGFSSVSLFRDFRAKFRFVAFKK